MNKKREIIMDSYPERISPKVSAPSETDIVPDDSELDLEDVDLRDSEIEALTAQYILDLMGAEDIPAEDISFDQEMLTEIVDEVERVLSDHGITIYRPTIVEDENGVERVVRSFYEENE